MGNARANAVCEEATMSNREEKTTERGAVWSSPHHLPLFYKHRKVEPIRRVIFTVIAMYVINYYL